MVETLFFPGGHTLATEHPTQTAQREGQEETGFQLQIEMRLATQSKR